ncbi:MAG: single-stranded-DNA-specific exonuclease RecJ [Clostridia bacterium]|nr:single-stranded-DNA-specific exonuclease RecJ [Clostridia bacterium]
MVIQNKIWQVAEPQPELQRELVRELRIPEIMAQILINRGVVTPAEARGFLAGDLNQLHDPYLLPGMAAAVERIMAAREQGEKVLVYGDYDVDGVTSTVVLLTVLRELGIQAHYYIPDRLEEGYGLNAGALERTREEGFSLVVTVDCGISAVAEVARAGELGLDVIITDHHEPQGEIPAALAVIDAKLPENPYPWPELAGVGVAFKLGQALLARGLGEGLGREAGLKLLDVVALGTIADIVPLKGENRVMVKHGLQILQNTQRAGMKALIKICQLEEKEITAGHVGFMLAPRINASGRLGSAAMAVELLLCEDEDQARQLAEFLDKENRERQVVEGEILEQVIKTIEEEYDLEHNPVIVLGADGWHHGVIGIVASRVVDRFYRPTILIALEGEEGKGSCRSVSGFNIFQALGACSQLLIRFGGHKQAAGLSLSRENLAAFRDEINRYARQTLTLADLTPKVETDGVVSLQELNLGLLEQMKQLEPFGFHNPSPLLLCRGAKLKECRTVGKTGDHLKLKVKNQGQALDGIGFNLGRYALGVQPAEEIDLAFALDRNEWNGRVSLQLKVKDLKPSGQADNPLEHNPEFYREKYGLKGRNNLNLLDQRGCHDKKGYLLQVTAGGRGTVVFTHDEAPEALCDGVFYYSFDCEGINLSSVENVILYYPGFSFDDFYQILGAAAQIEQRVNFHLVFGPNDLKKGEEILKSRYPDRDLLAGLYRLLKNEETSGALLYQQMEWLVEQLRNMGFNFVIEQTVEQGLTIFKELGLIEEGLNGENNYRFLVTSGNNKVDLDSSPCYRQGMKIREDYKKYGCYILETSINELVKQEDKTHGF